MYDKSKRYFAMSVRGPNMIFDFEECGRGNNAYSGGFNTLIARVPQSRISRRGEDLSLKT